MYATDDEVRDDAGFTGNTDISNDLITNYHTLAYSEVNSYVGSVYDLSYLTGTDFTGSGAENVLKRLEIMLSKAYLFQKIYGYDDDQDKNGYYIEQKALEELKMIKDGEKRLFDINNVEFTRIASSVGGLPRAGGYTVDEYLFSTKDEY